MASTLGVRGEACLRLWSDSRIPRLTRTAEPRDWPQHPVPSAAARDLRDVSQE
ncbi:hypothetical protein [Microcella alkaliphila]|nr:hypothetical protein [Microcella alkaliphila]